MTNYSLNDRWQENRNTWKDYWHQFTIENFAIALIIFSVAIVGFGYFNQHGGAINWTNIFGDFYANVSSELISIVITVLVLERLNNRRQDKQELTRLKALLGSNEAVVTKIAIAELRAKGWLEDGSLKNTRLADANLEGSNLWTANLENTKLVRANLKNANLERSNLSGARLQETNLEKANLRYVKIKEAQLSYANFKDAFMQHARFDGSYLDEANFEKTNLKHANFEGTYSVKTNFKGAYLLYANFEGAYLLLANFENAELYDAILPDGTRYSNPGDLERFTNSQHPEYRSTYLKIDKIRKKKGYVIH